MSVKYEEEQKKIKKWMDELRIEQGKEECKTANSDVFLASVRKYTRARKLTKRMVNELIEKIEIHQSEKINGITVQKITIHYNCIGDITIPDLKKIPENKVIMNTRQGVDIKYSSNAS